jgi:hypothetical protein
MPMTVANLPSPLGQLETPAFFLAGLDVFVSSMARSSRELRRRFRFMERTSFYT